MSGKPEIVSIESMQNILFHEIDGCLNTPDGRSLPFEPALLNTAQHQALRQLGDALNHSDIDLMVLNTGRSIAASVFLAKIIDSPKLKYIIAEHGAAGYAMDQSGHLDLVHLAQDIPHLKPVYTSLAQMPVLVNWYEKEGAKLLYRKINQNIGAAPKKANLTLRVPIGLCGDDMLKHLRDLIDAHAPVGGADLVYHHSVSDGYIDVMSEVDKGDGVQLIRHLLSNRQNQTYAVGNGTNDMPMFRHVDVCICPANADEPVFEYCKAKGFVSPHSFVDATLALLGKVLPTAGSDLSITT